MALTLESPAAPWEALAYLRAAAAGLPGATRATAQQVFGSRTLGWRDAQGLVCAVGLYPVGAGAECWLVGDPARARPHLAQIARQTRLTLAAAADHGVAPIMAWVRSGWEPGLRLAALAGFVAAGSRVPAEPVLWFEWRPRSERHGANGERPFRRRSGLGAEGGGG